MASADVLCGLCLAPYSDNANNMVQEDILHEAAACEVFQRR